MGGRAVFSCAQGYGLRGPHEAVCQHTGDWASPLPTCQGTIYVFNLYKVCPQNIKNVKLG